MLKTVIEKGSTEVRVDKNMVSIGKDGSSNIIASSEKDLVSGLSDSQRLEVLNMINKIEKGKK